MNEEERFELGSLVKVVANSTSHGIPRGCIATITGYIGRWGYRVRALYSNIDWHLMDSEIIAYNEGGE